MKKLINIALVFLTMLSGTIYAQSQLPQCQGSPWTWSNCFGTYSYLNGNQYAGEYLYGNFNGQGVLTLNNGNRYVGEFKR